MNDAMTFTGLAKSFGVLAMTAAIITSTAPVSADPPTRIAESSSGQRGSAGPANRPQREQELEAVQTEQKKAAATTARLKAEIDAIGEDRRQLNDALIRTAARVRAVEERIAATEGRIKTLEAEQLRVKVSLLSRREAISEILAALQRMGRRPPPAVLMRPDDALESVRTAMLLGAVLPNMRKDAEALAADLAEVVRLRTQTQSEHDVFARDLASLSEERERMSLLELERKRQLAETERAFESERARALALARQADDLKDLIAKFEKQVGPSARGAAAAARSNSASPGDSRTSLAALNDPGRLAPAIAFAAAKGALPLPVNGVRVREFGAADGLGGTERGLSILARSRAQVTAPCDGWVVYAGPFRSYGQLLILNAGGGYHVLLAGMERITVDLGQFVLTGEPVAVMGNGPQTAAAVAIGASQPILYVEFRKDGGPVDPGPWWMITDNEKVRG